MCVLLPLTNRTFSTYIEELGARQRLRRPGSFSLVSQLLLSPSPVPRVHPSLAPRNIILKYKTKLFKGSRWLPNLPELSGDKEDREAAKALHGALHECDLGSFYMR